MATDRYSLSNKCNTDAGIKKKLTIAEQRGANPYSFSVQLVCAPAGGLAPPFPTFLLSVFHYERGDTNKNWNASPLTLFHRKNIFDDLIWSDLIIVNHIYLIVELRIGSGPEVSRKLAVCCPRLFEGVSSRNRPHSERIRTSLQSRK